MNTIYKIIFGLLLILFIGLSGLFFASGFAYGFELNRTASGHIQRWDHKSLPLGWYINFRGFTGMSATDIEQSFQAAMSEWTNPPCTSFRAIYRGNTAATFDGNDRKNVFFFSELRGFSTLTLAVTTTTFEPATGRLLDADIAFRSTISWSNQPSPEQFDLLATAAHEIGHLLGLAHSSVSGATMESTARKGPNPQRHLSQDDINGLCFLYPRDLSSKPGRGLSCGTQSAGAGCPPDYICVLRTQQQQAYCVDICELDQCPHGGYCAKTTSGSQFCTCDRDEHCLTNQQCRDFACQPLFQTCLHHRDCAATERCIRSRCEEPTPCQRDADCLPDESCIHNQCLYPDTEYPLSPDGPDINDVSEYPLSSDASAALDIEPDTASEMLPNLEPDSQPDSDSHSEQYVQSDITKTPPEHDPTDSITPPENNNSGCHCHTITSCPNNIGLIIIAVLMLFVYVNSK
jgi:hypothetical protein